MRNMIQLLGGVAVAGVVAAGSTAFTAAGMTNSLANSSKVVAGGKVQVTPVIVGATLKTLTLTSHASTPDRYSAIVLTLADDNNAPIVSGTVAVTVADGGTGTATAVSCTYGSSVWTCTPGAAWQGSTIATIDVSVSNAAI